MKKTAITTIITAVITAAAAASLTGCAGTVQISSTPDIESPAVQSQPETTVSLKCSADDVTPTAAVLSYTNIGDGEYADGWYQDNMWSYNDQYVAEGADYIESDEYSGPISHSYIQDGHYTPDNQYGPEGIDVTANYQANDAVRRVFTVYGFTYEDGFTGYENKSFTECDGTKFHEIIIRNDSGMGDEVIGTYYVNDSTGEVMTMDGFHDIYGWNDAVSRVFNVYGFTYEEGFTGYEKKSFTEFDGTKFHEIIIGNDSGMGDEVIGTYYVNDSTGEVMTMEGFHDIYGWNDANI